MKVVLLTFLINIIQHKGASVYYKLSAIFIALFISMSYSESITITDCEDISLIKSAYANNKGITSYQNASLDTLVMNSWRC